MGYTGMLGGLVDSLTRIAIYPTYTICCEWLWSMPALIPGSAGVRWWSTWPTCKQLKLYWLRVPKITLGMCRGTNKRHFPVWMHSHSMRGTKVAATKGWWLPSRLPECSAPKTQIIASRLMHILLIYPLPLCISIILVMSLNDVTIICFPFLVGKALHMHRRAEPACLHIHQHPCQPILVFPAAMHGPHHQFCIPNFEPVTYIFIVSGLGSTCRD